MTEALWQRAVRNLARRFGTLGPPPATRALAPLRRSAVARAIESRRDRADELGRAIEAGDADARGKLAELAEAALAEMRADVRTRATQAGVVARLIAESDARWNDCGQGEYLDDPDLDEDLRRSIMADLDSVNDLFESYDAFLERIVPLLQQNGTASRVLDLAAGHGGFALEASRQAQARGLPLAFTASDIKQEYLDMGAEHAARDGLPVEFRLQDALDLSNLEHGEFDVITCTQSLHHFPPGLVAVMIHTAAHAAGRGVVFLDGCRSSLVGVAVSGIGLLGFRNRAFAHDAWVSTRRFFVPEELELLARLGSWGEHAESQWVPPGHCMLRLRPR